MVLLDFPELRQTYNYDCGATALEAVLAYYGIEVREELILKCAKTTKKYGTSIDGMVNTIKKYGLNCQSEIMTIENLKGCISKKIPVILLLQAWTDKKHINWLSDNSDEHYVVAIGYDKNNIYFEDPYSFRRTFLPYGELQNRWHDIDENEKRYINHGIAVFGKKPKFNSKDVIHMD